MMNERYHKPVEGVVVQIEGGVLWHYILTYEHTRTMCWQGISFAPATRVGAPATCLYCIGMVR